MSIAPDSPRAKSLIDFSKFQFQRVLSLNSEAKTAYLLGKYETEINGEAKEVPAIIKLEKPHFESEPFQGFFGSLTKPSEFYFENDIYSKAWLFPSEQFSRIQADIIMPCEEKMIQKYSEQKFILVRETPEIYQQVIKPLYIDKIDSKENEWIYNVLEHKKEVENIIFENEHFILQKDFKFNLEDKETLYCLALPQDRTLKSLRDINADHLPLLKSILENSFKALKETFGIDPTQIRAHFHYHPTFWHLHVHFCHEKMLQKSSAFLGRSIFLEEVIENLELFDPNYYQKRTMMVQVGERTKIFKLLQESGINLY